MSEVSCLSFQILFGQSAATDYPTLNRIDIELVLQICQIQ